MKRSGYVVATLLLVALALVATVPATTSGQAKAKDTIILAKGKSPLGGVKFEHKLHETRDAKCETCHHASKPEMPAKAAQQACSDCHTTPAKAPMKTNYQGAFHKPTGQAGNCIDCHKASNAKGSKAPVKCVDCHKKTNVASK